MLNRLLAVKSEIRNPKSEANPEPVVQNRRAGLATVGHALLRCLDLRLAGLLAFALLLAGAVSGLAQNQEAQWLAVLKSDAPRKDRADACRELARVATKESVPVLAALLADAEFNHMARYALEPIPDPSVDIALRDALGKLNGLQLVGVIGSLGVRHDAGADAALAKFLDNADPVVAQAAARALGYIATPAAVKSLEAALAKAPAGNQLALCEGLFRAAEIRLAKAQPQEAAAIYDGLRKVASAPHQVRAGALRGAILARGNAGLPLLLEGLRSDDFVLVAAAARTAQEMAGTEVTTALVAELPKLSTDKQVLVIQTLAWRKDAAAVPGLAATTKAGEAVVRLTAIRALTQTGSPKAAPALADLLGDPDKAITQAAQDGLISLPGTETDAVVLALVSHSAPARRLVGLEILGRRQPPGALPVLWTRVTDPDASVRAAALRRISELGGAGDLPRLLDLLAKPSDPQDFPAITQAIGTVAERSGSPDAAVETLTQRYASLPPAQQAALLGALGTAGGAKSLAVIREALKSPDAGLRAAATEALTDWKTFDAAPDLLQLATTATNPDTATAAFEGCVRLCAESDAPADQRLKLLTTLSGLTKNAGQKKRLLSGLGEIPTVESLQLVAKYVTEPPVANEAGAAAVKICSKLDAASKAAAAPVLNQVLKSAQAKPVLNGARKQMERLGIKPE